MKNINHKSVIDRKCRNSRIIYIAVTVFCVIFQFIYGKFSHGVYSSYMTWAFLIPFAGGLLTEISYHVRSVRYNRVMRQLLAGCVIWLTLGCMFKGVLEIYGTTNRLISVYLIAGIIQAVTIIIIFTASMFRKSTVRR